MGQDVLAVGVGRLQHDLAEADDHVEWRTQLVADVGHEVFFSVPGAFGFLPQPLGQRIEPAELEIGLRQVFQRLLQRGLPVARRLQQVLRLPVVCLPPAYHLVDGTVDGEDERQPGPDAGAGEGQGRQVLAGRRREPGQGHQG